MSDAMITYMLVAHALLFIILCVAVINLRSTVRELTEKVNILSRGVHNSPVGTVLGSRY